MDRVIEQDKYSNTPEGSLKNEVAIQRYELQTEDSFEFGSAYSIHPSLAEARRFHQDSWWKRILPPRSIYVSDSTLEMMMNNKDKMILWSWEN